MKSIYKIFFITGIIALFVASCNDDEFGPRKESTPVIESAAVSPADFTFGDSIVLTAKIIDPATTLSALAYEVVAEGRVVTSGEIPLSNDTFTVAQSIFVPLLSNQADAAIQVNLIARNILKGSASLQLNGLSAARPGYNQLYLVTDDGKVAILKPSTDKNKFEVDGLTFNPSFRFKIAEKLLADNTIDYTGDVYGNVNGKIEMIDDKGESAFAYTAGSDYTKGFVYDSYAFSAATTGSELGEDDLSLSTFRDEDIDGESFRTLKRTLENGKTYQAFGALSDAQNIYNPDFFERTAVDKIKFLGKTGEYTLYYNPVRKNIFVGVDNPSYPDFLLACGWGLGYPTNVSTEQIASVYSEHQRTHTDWGFDHVLKYVLFRQIGEGVYQGTFYTPNKDNYAGFKPYENTGWGNEKKAGEFTFTGEQIITGDNNWTIPNGPADPVVEAAIYRFTVDLNNKTVHIEKITL